MQTTKETTLDFIPSYNNNGRTVPARWRATVSDGFTVAIGEGRTPQEATEEARELRARRIA